MAKLILLSLVLVSGCGHDPLDAAPDDSNASAVADFSFIFPPQDFAQSDLSEPPADFALPTCHGVAGTAIDGTASASPFHARFAYYGLTADDDCGPRITIYFSQSPELSTVDGGSWFDGAPGGGLVAQQPSYEGACYAPDGGVFDAVGWIAGGALETASGTLTVAPRISCPLDLAHLPSVVKGNLRLTGTGWDIAGDFVAARCPLVDWYGEMCI